MLEETSDSDSSNLDLKSKTCPNTNHFCSSQRNSGYKIPISFVDPILYNISGCLKNSLEILDTKYFTSNVDCTCQKKARKYFNEVNNKFSVVRSILSYALNKNEKCIEKLTKNQQSMFLGKKRQAQSTNNQNNINDNPESTNFLNIQQKTLKQKIFYS